MDFLANENFPIFYYTKSNLNSILNFEEVKQAFEDALG